MPFASFPSEAVALASDCSWAMRRLLLAEGGRGVSPSGPKDAEDEAPVSQVIYCGVVFGRASLLVTLLVMMACDSGSDRPRSQPASSESAKPTASTTATASSQPPADPRVKHLQDAATALLSAVAKGNEASADTSAFTAPAPKLEAWFRNTFGPQSGNVLLTKWQEERGKDPKGDLLRAVKDVATTGATQVKVMVVDNDDAPTATSTQRAALKNRPRDRGLLHAAFHARRRLEDERPLLLRLHRGRLRLRGPAHDGPPAPSALNRAHGAAHEAHVAWLEAHADEEHGPVDPR